MIWQPRSLKEVALELAGDKLTEAELDQALDPVKMTQTGFVE